MLNIGNQQSIIADLLTQTQEGDVKEVLKAYYPTHTHKQQTKETGKQSVAKLKIASNFLKVKGAQALLKPALIQAIIVWIQNLLPDKCDICEEDYTFGLDDKPLLSCCICGQGAHDRCISRFVDNATEPVLKIPGTHWMCAACEKDIIPDPAGAATEQRHTQKTGRPDTQGEPETDTEREESSVGEEVYQGNQEIDQDRDCHNETETPPVCAHYKKMSVPLWNLWERMSFQSSKTMLQTRTMVPNHHGDAVWVEKNAQLFTLRCALSQSGMVNVSVLNGSFSMRTMQAQMAEVLQHLSGIPRHPTPVPQQALPVTSLPVPTQVTQAPSYLMVPQAHNPFFQNRI